VWKYIATRLDRRHALARRIALLLGVLVLVLVAYYLYERSQGLSAEDRRGVALYAEALEVVEKNYIDRRAIDPEKQTYGAIQGMLDSLNDRWHTSFLTPEEVEKSRERYNSKQVGPGIRLEDKDDEVVVLSTLDGSPAQEAGIEPGDVLVAVDGESVRGENIVEITDKLRGPEGSRVELTVLRYGQEEREFSIERAELEVPAASWNLFPATDVAHLRLASFSDDGAAELEGAISEAREAGAKRFVLDLRDNDGGWLGQAEEIAAQFLPAGSTIYIRRDAGGEEETPVPEGNEPLDVPLVVLVNVGSASSAELVAGALKDNGRAHVVGGKTFGAGTVLDEHALSDGSAILIATAQWLTPNRDPIQGAGIEPDVKASLGEGQKPRAPDELRGLSKEEIFAEDAQLKRAFEVVQKE
jgi:carboxyl-terminal processing protease